MPPETPKVVALSIGTPKWEDIGGRPVFTSIVRDPHPGPIDFGPNGIPGNLTAVHTEHVLAFGAEHYDYWARELGVPRDRWNWSWWGENLTHTGLDEHELRIGDLVRVGGAQFRVTSPRIPCFKLSWRLGQSDDFLLRLIETGRLGFHMQVVEPGRVAVGDPIEVTARSRDSLTVHDLSRLLADPGMDDVARLKAVAAIPALGDQAAGMIRKRITLIEDRTRMRTGRWRGWRRFTLSDVADEAVGVRSFFLRPDDEEPLALPAAGQFLTVRTERDGEPALARPWSVSHTDPSARLYRLSIKAVEGGAASQRMHRQLTVGDKVWARPPAGQFVLDRSGYRRIALISAGIGVTPLLPMLRAHQARGDEAPPLLWIHVTKNGRHHAFRREVAGLIAADANVQRLACYTDPDPQDRLGVDYDVAGRPTSEAISDLFAGSYRFNPFGREIDFPGAETEVYICGPKGFETLVREGLTAVGVKSSLIWSEAFAAAGAGGPGTAPAVERAGVRFNRSGLDAEWHVEDGDTLLDMAEAAGLNPAYACRTGACQTCECALISGDVAYDPVPSVQPAPGKVLICCARPNSPRVELDL